MTTRDGRRLAAFAAGCVLIVHASVAHAQTGGTRTTTAPEPSKGYVEAVGNATFGNVTSQAYGAEFGYGVSRTAQVYVEAGQVRNAATSTLSNAAQSIAGALTQLQPSAVSYSVKQPYNYFSAGIRYILNTETAATPYVIAGFGAAQVKKDVSFTLASNEPVSNYVTLGEDLTGTHTSGLLNLGGGVVWAAWQRLTVDFQFRYHRVFAEDEGMNVLRLGVGIGVKF